MSKKKIPLRPLGKWNLPTSHQDALSWYVLSKEPQTEVYRKFIRPDLQTSKAALDKLAKMFFADKQVQLYMESYERELDAILNPEKPEKKPERELTEADKQGAIRAVANQVVDLARRAGTEDVDIELVIKLMDKLQWLDDKEAAVEPPKRYLAITCSECRYKTFIEKECDDICEICKYKQYANENGVQYKSEEQLINN